MRDAVKLFIAGEWRAGAGGEREVIDPGTGQPSGCVCLANEADIDRAVAAAEGVRKAWRDTPAIERGAILTKAAALLRERATEIARGLTLEQGKTLAESAGEINRAIETLTWNGEEASRIGGRSLPGRARNSSRMLVPAPVGVVAAFTAWNFPAVLTTRKLGAALAAGCPVVLKAAEEAPYTAAAIVQALADAGAPPGVVNLLFGDPPVVAGRLLKAPDVRKVTFTGSTRVGKELARLAADDLKRCTFELGGHAPVIVCADGNVDAAVTATMAFKFTSAGQSCIAPSRFYIHKSRMQEFAGKFTAAARALKVGNGTEAGMQMGSLANERRLAAMQRYTDDAVAQGGEVTTGGAAPGPSGIFLVADGAGLGARSRGCHARGAVRSDRADGIVRGFGRGHRPCQCRALWLRRLSIHAVADNGGEIRERDRGRQYRHQPDEPVLAGCTGGRSQGQRLRL